MSQVDFVIFGLLFIPLIIRMNFYYKLNKFIKSNKNYTANVNIKLIYLPLIPLVGIYYLFILAKKIDQILDSVFQEHKINRPKEIYQLLSAVLFIQTLLAITISASGDTNPMLTFITVIVFVIRIVLGIILHNNLNRALEVIK